eukprot:CAMPEP_0197417062 /NCGR_PEP_ID=MMETSP1170-20131217/3218_1 /TAXON_ID=54406 /ORGANISM="Sarcinochrysis sp, Strain CCMP770" /LENGTH=163 /DNA_ID=CAMNT_0042944001 /DNA_START=6 /DNA_END=497 /DNA_ORIENTATION=-
MLVVLLTLAAVAQGFVVAPSKASSRVVAVYESSLYLCDDHVDVALGECRERYPAVFYQDDALGMSGAVRRVDIDGCAVTLRLDGMFWHERRVVFDLVATYLQARIPEICDVQAASAANLDDSRKRAPDLNGDRYELERLGYEADDAVVIDHRPGLTFTGFRIL